MWSLPARGGRRAPWGLTRIGGGSAARGIVLSFPVVSACVVSLLYGPGLGNAFVYDDLPQIVDNPAVHSVLASLAYFSQEVAFDTGYLSAGGTFYRPLFWLSLSLDYAVWQERAAGFHLTNVLLHWLCGVLLWRVLLRLPVPTSLAFGVPLVWLTLPINTEVVAWISGRPFSLATVCILSGLLVLARQLTRPHWRSLLLLGLAFLSALLSHEVGLLLPLLSVLVAAYGRGRSRVDAGLLVAFACPLIAYLALRAGADSSNVVPDVQSVVSALRRVPLLMGRYGEWIILPPRLSIDRSTDWTGLLASGAVQALGWVVLSAVAAGTLMGLRRRALWGFGLAWYGISMLPFLNLIPLYQGMAERYAYLPSIGLAIALGAALVAGRSSGVVVRSMCGVAIVALVGWYAWRTGTRVVEWRDEWSIYRASLAATPRSHVLRFNLAVKHAEAGRLDEAEDLYREALMLNDGYLAAKVNLANLLQRRGEFSQAKRYYEEVLDTAPDRREALLNLANLHQRVGDFAQAEAVYQRALAIDPNYLEAKLNLGVLWQTLGKDDSARAAYLDVLSDDPHQPQAHLNLGVLLFDRGDVKAAVEHLLAATRLQPGYAEAHFNLGVAYEASGDVHSARREYARALDLRPNYEKARMGLMRLDRP